MSNARSDITGPADNPAINPAKKDIRPIHIAIAGVGKVALQNYLPALVKHEDVRLRYYNRTSEKATAAAQQFGGDAAATLADLMADPPDAVLVLTSEKARAEIIDKLLVYRPKRLFFEKPLVAELGQAAVTEADFWRARELWQSLTTAFLSRRRRRAR
jgi:hypothetical protein